MLPQAVSPPRLSIIIPHLNEPEDLRRCLHALTAQDRGGIPIEIIVVDNGSRVLPLDVCSAFADVRLESERTPGPGPARNRGARVARADLYAFIDSDCIAEPGWIRAIVGYMEDHPDVDFIGGDIRIIPADAVRLSAIEAYESIFSYRNDVYVERHGFSATGNMAVRASVFEAVGPFGGIATMEDTEWGQRATSLGYRIGYVASAVARTPSCKSFPELARRWDRHVAHEFRQNGKGGVRSLLWAFRSAVIAASPLGEVPRILRTDRLSRFGDRLMALACLTRVRLYRAQRMLALAMVDRSAATVGSWNRDKS